MSILGSQFHLLLTTTRLILVSWLSMCVTRVHWQKLYDLGIVPKVGQGLKYLCQSVTVSWVEHSTHKNVKYVGKQIFKQ